MENAYQKGRHLSRLESEPEIADARDIFFRGDPNYERQAGEKTNWQGRKAEPGENILFQPLPALE
jgi:hypothetical protein